MNDEAKAYFAGMDGLFDLRYEGDKIVLTMSRAQFDILMRIMELVRVQLSVHLGLEEPKH